MGVVLIWLRFVLQPLRKEGDSNPRYPNRVRQFSKLVVSATHPSFLTEFSVKEWCKGRQKKTIMQNIGCKNFYKWRKMPLFVINLGLGDIKI